MYPIPEIVTTARERLAQARLADSNANLVARALGLAGELAAAAGPAWDRAGRPLLAPALLGLADKKKQARLLPLLPLLSFSLLPSRVLLHGGRRNVRAGRNMH